MSDFFRYPSIPHLAWLGEGLPRDDKLCTPEETEALLGGEVVVEEKVDGANIGISFGPDAVLRVQNRGQYLIPPYIGQFKHLHAWLESRQDALFDALADCLILFGEWCAARHSLHYDRLPDWFLLFDVYDRETGRFWSSRRRAELADRLGLFQTPPIFEKKLALDGLVECLERQPSRLREGPLEGLVVRKEDADWLEQSAKLVQPDFTQAITEHWRRKPLQWNQTRSPSKGKPAVVGSAGAKGVRHQ